MGDTPGVTGRSRPPTESGRMNGPAPQDQPENLSGNRVAPGQRRGNVGNNYPQHRARWVPQQQRPA